MYVKYVDFQCHSGWLSGDKSLDVSYVWKSIIRLGTFFLFLISSLKTKNKSAVYSIEENDLNDGWNCVLDIKTKEENNDSVYRWSLPASLSSVRKSLPI